MKNSRLWMLDWTFDVRKAASSSAVVACCQDLLLLLLLCCPLVHSRLATWYILRTEYEYTAVRCPQPPSTLLASPEYILLQQNCHLSVVSLRAPLSQRGFGASVMDTCGAAINRPCYCCFCHHKTITYPVPSGRYSSIIYPY